jgi:hypothetical protein
MQTRVLHGRLRRCGYISALKMPSELLSATGRVWTINPPTVLLRTDYSSACILKPIGILLHCSPRIWRSSRISQSAIHLFACVNELDAIALVFEAVGEAEPFPFAILAITLARWQWCEGEVAHTTDIRQA